MTSPTDLPENPNHPGTWAALTPDKPAVIMASNGESMTYAELEDKANRLSQLFHAAGLRPGDHMSFCMENRLDYLAILWGAHYAGLYYTAISSRLTTEELGYILEDSGSRAFITSPYKAEDIAGLGDVLEKIETKLVVGGEVEGFEDFEAAIAKFEPTPLPDRMEAQPMLYSSGTTGRPKGVKPTFPGTPLGAGDGMTMMTQFLFGGSGDSVYLSPAPLYHAAPLRYCQNFLRMGSTVVVMERFDAEGALAAIDRYKCTHSQWVPTMFVRMLKLEEEVRDQYLSLIHI